MTNGKLVWQPQELSFDDSESRWHFRLDGSKPVVSTQNATTEFTREEILSVLQLLERKAFEHCGLDYLQTFKDEMHRRLWMIENDEAITALLPEDY